METFTRSAEDAGTISVNASNNIVITGQNENGPSEITSASLGDVQGNGGPIIIATPNLKLMDQARITAISEGIVTAGSIDIIIENLEIFNGSIETNAAGASGGDIRVNAGSSQRLGVIV